MMSQMKMMVVFCGLAMMRTTAVKMMHSHSGKMVHSLSNLSTSATNSGALESTSATSSGGNLTGAAAVQAFTNAVYKKDEKAIENNRGSMLKHFQEESDIATKFWTSLNPKQGAKIKHIELDKNCFQGLYCHKFEVYGLKNVHGLWPQYIDLEPKEAEEEWIKNSFQELVSSRNFSSVANASVESSKDIISKGFIHHSGSWSHRSPEAIRFQLLHEYWKHGVVEWKTMDYYIKEMKIRYQEKNADIEDHFNSSNNTYSDCGDKKCAPAEVKSFGILYRSDVEIVVDNIKTNLNLVASKIKGGEVPDELKNDVFPQLDKVLRAMALFGGIEKGCTGDKLCDDIETIIQALEAAITEGAQSFAPKMKTLEDSFNQTKAALIKKLQDLFEDDSYESPDDKYEALIDCNKDGKNELKEIEEELDNLGSEFKAFKSDIESCLTRDKFNKDMSLKIEGQMMGQNHRYADVKVEGDVIITVNSSDLDKHFEELQEGIFGEDEGGMGLFGNDDY